MCSINFRGDCDVGEGCGLVSIGDVKTDTQRGRKDGYHRGLKDGHHRGLKGLRERGVWACLHRGHKELHERGVWVKCPHRGIKISHRDGERLFIGNG